MKHGSFKIFCILILICFVAIPGFSDESTVSLESRILESFNGDSDYIWKTDASRFITKTDEMEFPQLAYVEAYPIAIFGHNRGGDPIRSLGIHCRFDRRGYNWLDIFPTTEDSDGEPIEIPMPGRVRSADMWVWGSNHNFYIEMYVRDNEGVVHNIRLGDIGFQGWRNISANIPNHIRQGKRLLPRHAPLTFVKFRLWTQPTEKVGDFYVYFKNFKILTDMFEAFFDGDDLANPDRVQELWAEAAN